MKVTYGGSRPFNYGNALIILGSKLRPPLVALPENLNKPETSVSQGQTPNGSADPGAKPKV